MNASISTQVVYKVTAPGNTSDGTGGTVILGYFLHAGTAHEAAKGQGTFGGDAKVEPVNTQVVESGDEMWLLGDKISKGRRDQAKVRAEALKKLTQEEREALGLV